VQAAALLAMKASWPSADLRGRGLGWQAWLELEILRREAERLLNREKQRKTEKKCQNREKVSGTFLCILRRLLRSASWPQSRLQAKLPCGRFDPLRQTIRPTAAVKTKGSCHEWHFLKLQV
jgi:hypothetical protein